MAQRDFYEVLGVPRGATADEIRKAYKKLAKKHHPDAKPGEPGSQQKFAEISEAYEVLGDDEKRKKYDQFGHAFRGGESAGNPFQGFGGGAGADFDLNDLLGGMFGGGRGKNPFQQGAGRRGTPQPRKGDDAQAEILVPFAVAVEGGAHELSIRIGTKSERLTVKIPAGIEDGKAIRLSGQGHPGVNGGPDGDLLVTIRSAPHPWFRREGRNLVVDVPITPSEAALGARVDVPTLSEGSVVVTVPPGTSSGAKLRLRGKGVADPRGGERGDQIVVIRIVVPKDLSDEARSLFEQLSRATPVDPRSELWK